MFPLSRENLYFRPFVSGRISRESPEKEVFLTNLPRYKRYYEIIVFIFHEPNEKEKKRGGRTRIDRGSKLIEKFPRSDRESPNKMVPKWQKFLRKGVYIMWKSPGKGL